LRQVGAFAAQQIAHILVAFREQVHVLLTHVGKTSCKIKYQFSTARRRKKPIRTGILRIITGFFHFFHCFSQKNWKLAFCTELNKKSLHSL
ncbi:MAG: hypothetical protein ACOYJY_06245, partial [Acutalibacteraceae bacterium]